MKTEILAYYTEDVAPDLYPPILPDTHIQNGYDFNLESRSVVEACSSWNLHGYGKWSRVYAQGPISLYSTKLLALKALRRALELRFATELKDLDKQIRGAEAREIQENLS